MYEQIILMSNNIRAVQQFFINYRIEIQTQMGNQNKKPEQYEVVRGFRPEQWLNKQKRPGYQIWQNPNRGLHADVYPITSQIKTQDLDHYEMRHNNSTDIVKVHGVRMNKQSSLCSKSSDAHVYVQRIPYRLTDVSQLSVPQALSVLRSTYSGFNTVSTFYGLVQPYEDMICFNEQNKTKIWVNSNLAQNRVQKQKQSITLRNAPNINQSYINKIFDMVQNKTVNRQLPPALKNKFIQSNSKTYFQALNLVQEFAGQNRINIPDRIGNRGHNTGNTNVYNSNVYHNNNSSSYNQDTGSTVHNYSNINTTPVPNPPLYNNTPTLYNTHSQQPPQLASSQVQSFPYTTNITNVTNNNLRSTLPANQTLINLIPSQHTLMRNGSQKLIGYNKSVRNSQVQNNNILSGVVVGTNMGSRYVNTAPYVNTTVNTVNNVNSRQLVLNGGSRVVGSHVGVVNNIGSRVQSPYQPPKLISATPVKFQSPSKVLQNYNIVKQFNNSNTNNPPIIPVQSLLVTQTMNTSPPSSTVPALPLNQQNKPQSPIKNVCEQAILQSEKKIQITQEEIKKFQQQVVPPQQIRQVQQQRLAQETSINNNTNTNININTNTNTNINTNTNNSNTPIKVQMNFPQVPQVPQIQQQQQQSAGVAKFVFPPYQPQPMMRNNNNTNFNNNQQYAAHISNQYQYGYTNQPHLVNYQLFNNQQIYRPVPGNQIMGQQQMIVSNTQLQNNINNTTTTVGQNQTQPQQQVKTNINTTQPNNQSKQHQQQQQQRTQPLSNQQNKLVDAYSQQNDNDPYRQQQQQFDEVQRHIQRLQQDRMYDNVQQQYQKQQQHPEGEDLYQDQNHQQQYQAQFPNNNNNLNTVNNKQSQIKQQGKKIQIIASQQMYMSQQNQSIQIKQSMKSNKKQQKKQDRKQVQQQLAGSQQSNDYFPFATQMEEFKMQPMKRVATMEINYSQLPKPENPSNLEQIRQKTHQSQLQQQNQKNQNKITQKKEVVHQSKNQVRLSEENTNNVFQQQEQITSSYNGGYDYQFKRKNYRSQVKQQQRIPDNARYEDIQNYIRNKYRTQFGGESTQFRPSSSVTPYTGRDNQLVDVREMASYVQSKYDQYAGNQNNDTQYDPQFSFKPSAPAPAVTQSATGGYSYMRVEHDYNKYHQDSLSQVKLQQEKRSSLTNKQSKQIKKQQKTNQEGDMLDVGFLERSLDKKYNSMKSQQQIKALDNYNKKQEPANGGFQFDVAKLQENLVRFQQSRVGTGGSISQQRASNTPQLRFETSQVSKINSIDYRLGHQRRSSVQKDFNVTGNDGTSAYSPESYENQSPIYQYQNRKNARASKNYTNIDQKFDKYVNKIGPSSNVSSRKSQKQILKQKQENYDYRDNDYNNNVYDSSSRMATGHFGYTQNSKQPAYGYGNTYGGNTKQTKTSTNEYEAKTTFITSQVSRPKGLSYQYLRKFMWS